MVNYFDCRMWFGVGGVQTVVKPWLLSHHGVGVMFSGWEYL